MSRVEPAVVYRPDDRLAVSRQELEQYLIVQEIAVDVMDVDDVRIQLLYLSDEPLVASSEASP